MAADYIIALRPREWSVDGLGKAIAEVTKVPVCDQQLVPDTNWKPIQELSPGSGETEPVEMMSKHPLDYYDIKPGSKMNDNPGSRSNIVSVPSSCAMAIS